MNLIERHDRSKQILDENAVLDHKQRLVSPLAQSNDYPHYKGKAYADQWGRVWGLLPDGTVEDLSAALERFMND